MHGKQQREGSIPPPGRADTGQGWLLPAGLQDVTGIKMQSLTKDAEEQVTRAVPLVLQGPGSGTSQCDPHPSQGSCQKRQLLVIIYRSQQSERRRIHIPVGDFMAQSHLLLGEQKFRAIF